MKRSAVGFTLLTGAVAALAVMQWATWRQQNKIAASLAHIADGIEGSSHDDPRPSVSYQLKMNGSLTKEDLRAVIREELLANKGATAAAPDHDESADSVKPPASPVNQQAFQSARRLVDNAIASRIWGEQQATDFAALRHQMTSEQVTSLLADLIPAINSQQLKVQVAGLPF